MCISISCSKGCAKLVNTWPRQKHNKRWNTIKFTVTKASSRIIQINLPENFFTTLPEQNLKKIHVALTYVQFSKSLTKWSAYFVFLVIFPHSFTCSPFQNRCTWNFLILKKNLLVFCKFSPLLFKLILDS